MRRLSAAMSLAWGLLGCESESSVTPTFRQASAALTEAAISWEFEGAAVDWTLAGDEAEVPRCVLLYQTNFPQTPEPDPGALFGPWLECSLDSGGFLDIGFPGHLDLRDLGVGVATFVEGDDELPVVYFSSGSTVCELDLATVQLEREVSEATGAALAYPELVSEDYRRAVRFAFETGVVDGELRDNSGTCSGSITVDAALEQTPEHYVTKDAFEER